MPAMFTEPRSCFSGKSLIRLRIYHNLIVAGAKRRRSETSRSADLADWFICPNRTSCAPASPRRCGKLRGRDGEAG